MLCETIPIASTPPELDSQPPRPTTWISAIASCLAITGMLGIMGCSSAPARMHCSEIRGRIDYGGLTADQLRFAYMELKDCEDEVRRLEANDSAFLYRGGPSENSSADGAETDSAGSDIRQAPEFEERAP